MKMKRSDVRKFVYRALPATAVLIVIAQFIPISKNNPPKEAELQMPAEVKSILKRACYDCHSRETVWPWYSSIAPVSWLISHDVHEGREELDFSAWNRIEIPKRGKKLKKLREEIDENEMPPWYYLVIHRRAGLSAEDHRILDEWAAGLGREYSRVRDEEENDTF